MWYHGGMNDDERLRAAPVPRITANPWPDGGTGAVLHLMHCRDDRCQIGCGCPCHDGNAPRLSWRARLSGALSRRWLRNHPAPPAVTPGRDSGETVSPDPAWSLEQQLHWYQVASHIMLLSCGELVRRKAAAAADREVAQRARRGSPGTSEAGFWCEARAWTGPGHQSSFRCTRREPHPLDGTHWVAEVVHEWTGPQAFAD